MHNKNSIAGYSWQKSSSNEVNRVKCICTGYLKKGGGLRENWHHGFECP